MPTFQVSLERDGSAPLALDVPCSFTAGRFDRLVAFLAREHWAVAACGSPASSARLAGASERELHAAELHFIRELGTLRSKAGTAVPEKVRRHQWRQIACGRARLGGHMRPTRAARNALPWPACLWVCA